jgi:DNA primase
MTTEPRAGIADYYERDVLPALTHRLDTAFPEFGWVRDTHGWRATNQAFTHDALGVRAERVVCHGDAPRGFLIHGQGATLWTTYLNGGRPARGRDFVTAVRTLAERAALDPSHLDRPPTSAERTADLLHDAFVLSRRELASDRGVRAREYLESRGIPTDRIGESGLGLMPDTTRMRLALVSNGYSDTEISASMVTADPRWAGRIVGAWRDNESRVTTVWARTLTPDANDRYLYLKGAPRPATTPYGLSTILANGSRSEARDLLLVEGVIDVHILRAHALENVAALGGTATSSRLFEKLADVGVANVTLALDSDSAGRTATTRAIEAATNAARSRQIWVIDPDLLDGAKDPGDLIRASGREGWERASAAPICGITTRALELTGPLEKLNHELGRRASLARASAWLGTLHPRHAIEQIAALDAVADTLGYDGEAVRRTFRARHWRSGPERTPSTTAIER